MSATAEETTESPRRRPRKLRRGPGNSSVDEGRISSEVMENANDDAEARASFDRQDDELPELGIDDQSSMNDDPSFLQKSDGGDNNVTFDEGEMRRHFMDVESSFLPDMAPAQQPQPAMLGVDDTYLELGKPGHTPPPDEMFASLSGRKPPSHHLQGIASDTGEGAHHTPTHEVEDDEDRGAYASPSSPSAAAAQRGHGRNISVASVKKITPMHAREISVGSIGDFQDKSRPTSKGSTIRPESSPRQQDSASATKGNHKVNGSSVPSRFSSRSMYQRHMSRTSSVSSSTLDSELSGSDQQGETNKYFLGGSLKDNPLARLPSYGSSTSYMDTDAENAPTSNPIISAIRSGRYDGKDDERPETPRGNAHPDIPTDTVIAQHVRNIQVPDTVARDFRARNRSLSPEKQRPASSGVQGTTKFQGVPRRTLTLKEQNSKIDKLTKENFDLKLKIHFLDQALQSRSEEGVKELIDKNVQLQTDLANERKDSQGLRRKLRELEKKAKEQDEKIAQLEEQQKQQKSSRDVDDDDPTLQAEMHEEILYLRQQLDHSENKVTTLQEEVLTKEFEKRKMAEHMRSMAGQRGEDTAGMKETMDMWQDLLNAETGRREQAEEDIRKLREELTNLRIERASPAPAKLAKTRNLADYEESVAESEYTNGIDGLNGEPTAAMVEQLKHENAELRRDLGAQTSMLTSRNRERERLQQEIEDLKLLQRKSDGARSVAGDSIFDRSISRAHQRAPSRASDAATQVTEAEREDWDKKEGALRDQNAEMRLKYQDLERKHNTHLQYVSVLEGDYEQMERELNEASEDLKSLQTERDEALQAYEGKEEELQNLEQEALAEIDKLEKEVESLQVQLEDSHRKLQKTHKKLENTADSYNGLQTELREITQSVMNLEDEKQINMRTIQNLEQQISDTEDELQKWEQKCKDIDQKNRKLEITQESLHSEITFLRDEQEGDKIKIGELEDALGAAQQTITDEQEKLRELEDGVIEERQQRDILENKSKEEVQKVLDDLNNESQKTKDEVRKLRRNLSAKEVEASTWKQRLDELEQTLRSTLGDPNGTKQTLLAAVEKLQRDLETTANALDRAKMDMADKERLLRHRDGLLESTSLESRRLSDLLDKERSSRRRDLEQFEKSSRGQATHMRTIAQQESRVLELESQHTQDRRKWASIEETYRDQLSERNNLLLAQWNRLSTLCGADWAQHHALVEGENPSADVINRKLPAFSKNLISAVKTLEGLFGTFKVRIRSIEKDLWKDYQTLEHNLDIKIRRMDQLEQAVRHAQKAIADEAAQRPPMSRAGSNKLSKGMNTEKIAKLESEVKVLKAELKFHRQYPSAMAQQMNHQQNQQNPEHMRRVSSSGASIKSTTSPARQIMSTLLRHNSTSAVEQLQERSEEVPPPPQPLVVPPQQPAHPSEQRWIHRLKELERRLKAEREARLLDRRGARQRLEERQLENDELRQQLEHEKMRHELREEDDERADGGGFMEEREESDNNHASSGVD